MKSVFTFLLVTLMIGATQAQPGTPDKTYGLNGLASFTNQPYIVSSAMQTDNKLLTGGSGNTFGEFTMVRHNADGSLDSSFGDKGLATITFTSPSPTDDIYYQEGLTGIAVQPDGKIVATGDILSSNNDIILIRLLSNGTLDESFGLHGKVITDLGNDLAYAEAVALQKDGKIVVAGYSRTDIIEGSSSELLLRYNSNGTLDASFGGTGSVKYTRERGNRAYAVLIQPDGNIVTAGGQAGVPSVFFLTRYLPNGTLDNSFGNGGAVKAFTTSTLLGGGTQANSVGLDSKGRIVAAGVLGSYEGVGVVRFLPSGVPDNSFGTKGQVQLSYNGLPYIRTDASTVLVQPNNKLVISSAILNNFSGLPIIPILSGLNENGSIDSSFGIAGQTVSAQIHSDFFEGAAMQSDGKIVVAGNNYSDETNVNIGELARYLGYPVQVPLAIRIKRYLQNHTVTWNGLPADDNIISYSVEQSSNSNKDFAEVTKVSGRSNLKDYSITNSHVLQGMNYYRIKAVSTDGVIRYSEVVSADNTANTASVYPNPAKNYVTVQNLPNNEMANISIKDGSGTVLARGVSTGSGQYRSPLGSNMQPGTYYLNITTRNKTEVLKFVKE